VPSDGVAKGCRSCLGREFQSIGSWWVKDLSVTLRHEQTVGRWRVMMLFPVNGGVRQGGVLSPYIFAVYINQFNRTLETSGLLVVVCYLLGGVFDMHRTVHIMSWEIVKVVSHCFPRKLLVMNVLFTECTMQSMFDICSIVMAKLHLHFNSKKSVTLQV